MCVLVSFAESSGSDHWSCVISQSLVHWDVPPTQPRCAMAMIWGRRDRWWDWNKGLYGFKRGEVGGVWWGPSSLSSLSSILLVLMRVGGYETDPAAAVDAVGSFKPTRSSFPFSFELPLAFVECHKVSFGNHALSTSDLLSHTCISFSLNISLAYMLLTFWL